MENKMKIMWIVKLTKEQAIAISDIIKIRYEMFGTDMQIKGIVLEKAKEYLSVSMTIMDENLDPSEYTIKPSGYWEDTTLREFTGEGEKEYLKGKERNNER